MGRPNNEISLPRGYFEHQAKKVKSSMSCLLQKESLNEQDIQALKILTAVYEDLSSPVNLARGTRTHNHKNVNKMELSEKDIHCIARNIQSALFAESLFYGCQYCTYRSECRTEVKQNEKLHFDNIREKLCKITGVDLNLLYSEDNLAEKFKSSTGYGIMNEIADELGISIKDVDY